MLCIGNPQDIARILYQSMLKAPSGSQEWHILFPSESNSP